MRYMFKLALLALGLVLAPLSHGALKVFATVPEWGALAREIGGDKVDVFTATTALQDVHRIEAKPSLIARARSAQLVVATGADLEIAWLPLVLREAGNAQIQPGQRGYFEAARQVRMLEIPQRLDRAEGDVHPAGNPHIQTDPRNVLKVGEALARGWPRSIRPTPPRISQASRRSGTSGAPRSPAGSSRRRRSRARLSWYSTKRFRICSSGSVWRRWARWSRSRESSQRALI